MYTYIIFRRAQFQTFSWCSSCLTLPPTLDFLTNLQYRRATPRSRPSRPQPRPHPPYSDLPRTPTRACRAVLRSKKSVSYRLSCRSLRPTQVLLSSPTQQQHFRGRGLVPRVSQIFSCDQSITMAMSPVIAQEENAQADLMRALSA